LNKINGQSPRKVKAGKDSLSLMTELDRAMQVAKKSLRKYDLDNEVDR